MDWKTIKNWGAEKYRAADAWISAKFGNDKNSADAWKFITVGAFIFVLAVTLVTLVWINNTGALRDIALVMAAILGFPLLFQRTRAASLQAETDSRRRMAEAYSQAADLFSKTALPLRLAGLYALWKIAKEDPENHHVQIMQILCAFVRNPTPLDGWESGSGGYPARRLDMEAVINLIAHGRNEQQIKCEREVGYQMDFRNANLGRADFRKANLRGAQFDLADLYGANFEYAEFDDKTSFKFAAINEMNVFGVREGCDSVSEGVYVDDGQGPEADYIYSNEESADCFKNMQFEEVLTERWHRMRVRGLHSATMADIVEQSPY